MAKIIDTRNAGGQLVILGDSIVFPSSNSSSFANTAPLIAGSMRFNPTLNALQYLSNGSTDWMAITAVDVSAFLERSGGVMTGNITMSNAATLNLDPTGGLYFNATSTGLIFNSSNPVLTYQGTNNFRVTNSAITSDSNYGCDIGTSGTNFANVYAGNFFGTSTTARYADLAERYHADAVYDVGTVLVIGGVNEVTISTHPYQKTVAGIVSENPALKMNSEAGDDNTHPYIALRGRVLCKVIGPVLKGDLLVTSNVAGYAMTSTLICAGELIGKALCDFNGDQGLIEVMV